jgi:hypothetical protein
MADNDNGVVDLWQNQTADGFRMTTEEIKMKVHALDSKMRARTRIIYLMCAFLIIAVSTWAVVEHDLLMRVGAAALIIAVTFLGFQGHRSRFRTLPASSIGAPSIDHLRAELQRQVDFHRGKLLWSRMLLLAPAGLFFFFAFARAHPEVIAMIRFEIAAFVVLTIAAIPLNRSMAKKYERQIDEIDREDSKQLI